MAKFLRGHHLFTGMDLPTMALNVARRRRSKTFCILLAVTLFATMPAEPVIQGQWCTWGSMWCKCPRRLAGKVGGGGTGSFI